MESNERRCRVSCSRYFTCFVAVMLSVSFLVSAQEVPYGVENRQKLDAILKEAKVHLASNADDAGWLKTAGIASHQLAWLKVDSASEDAVQYLKRASSMRPADTELLAYLGSSHAMLARDSSLTVNKISNTNKGLALLDRAVRREPDNLTVRIIRGSVAYELPPMFSREKTAQDDYLFVLKAAKAGARVTPERLSEIYFKLGQLAAKRKQIDVADKFYAKARSVAPRSAWAEKARKASR
ncbi:MAG: hypothetical protein HOP03_17100 [Lysobacter sp.]|nr:hypothetical protein [Lysobacter sp.]